MSLISFSPEQVLARNSSLDWLAPTSSRGLLHKLVWRIRDFALWKDPEPDIPILVAAKAEYAKRK